MEKSKQWNLAIVAIFVVGIVVFSTVGYFLLVEDEEELPPDQVILISGEDLDSSELVDSGSGTADDPYVITDLDVEVVTVNSYHRRAGVAVVNVSAHLILSGVTVQVSEGTPVYGVSTIAGIAITDSENVTVLDCDFEGLSVGVSVEGSEHINVTVCRFDRCDFGVMVIGSHEQHARGDITVLGNRFTKCGTCIETDHYEKYSGKIVGVDKVLIDRNTFAHSEIAARTLSASDVVVTNNSVYAMMSLTFDLPWVNHARIANNSLYCFGDAISLYFAADVEVTGNDIAPVGGGILVSGSTNLTISRNVIRGDTYGTHLHGVSEGIWVEACKEVCITYNVVVGNAVGIALISTEFSNTSAVVHHNGIYDNDIQAFDNIGSANLWDDGVGEGNCWSDDYSRFGLVDANSDDILDGPYAIDSDSQDRYPLAGSIIPYGGDIAYFSSLPLS